MSLEQAKREILGGKDYPTSSTTLKQQQDFDEEFKHVTLVVWPELLKLMPCPVYGDPNFNRYLELLSKIVKFSKKCFT